MHLPTNETVRGPAASMLGRVALLATLAALFLPAAASAADSVYWGNEGSGTVQFGNLDGTGSVGSLFGGENAPAGSRSIRQPARSTGPTSMATSGSGTSTARAATDLIVTPDRHPCGVAVDPAGKIYWAEFVSVGTTAGTIRRANLDGSERGDAGLRSVRPEWGCDRPRSQQDLLDQPGPRRPQRRGLARGPERLECAGDCAQPGRIRSGSRSTGPPARSTGPTLAPAAAVPARSGPRIWTAPPPRTCSAARAARAGWQSTPRQTRSTGPISAPASSGSGTSTARAPP